VTSGAWSFVHYACGHQSPTRGGDRHLDRLCPECVVPEIARRFALDYRENVTSEAYEETRYRNAQPDYRLGCATHDFLDANECMAFAFEATMGRPADPSESSDTKLWNDAWDLARREYLTATPSEATAWDIALVVHDNDLARIRAWRGHHGPLGGPVVSEATLQSLAGYHRDPRRHA
jgi:hypothetical protein